MVGRPGKYQPRFTSGELDPLFAGNTDVGDYLKGASLMQNVRPFPQGGFGNMWGTRAIGTVPALAGGAHSAARIRSFTHSRDAAYDLVFSENRADVYGASGALYATITLSLTSAQISKFKSVQQLDTMILFHQDKKPVRIRRTGSDTSWTVDDAPLANLPNYDYGGVYTNAVAAVWTLNFFNLSVGNHYTIAVNGEKSLAIAWAGDHTTDAVRINGALSSIPGVGAGLTTLWGDGSTSTPGGTLIPAGVFAIEFSGVGNEGDGWAVSGEVVDNASAAITASHLTVGVLGGEAIVSETRGWPGCGAIYGGRLIMAGLKSLPNFFLASQSENYWNFDTRLTSASAPMRVPIDTDGAATILDTHKGRTLDFFTDGGEYWLSGAALDRTQTPTIVSATPIGVTPGVPVVENEGATIFCGRTEEDVAEQTGQPTGGALFEFRFDYSQQNYSSVNLSVRASGLVDDIVDLAIRRGLKADDFSQLWALRGDGMAVVCHLLRAEQITAFARRVTDGKFEAVNVNDRRQITFVVNRLAGGTWTQSVERQEQGLLLDQAVDFNLGTAGVAVTGLAALEGATVWAVADKFVQGPFTVTGGAITLNFPAVSGYVGRWTPPRVRTMAQPRDIAPRTVMRRPCRVHTVRVQVLNTTSIAIGANDEPPEDVPLRRMGQPADVAPLDMPYTGWIAVEGLQGFSEDGIVEITQLRPGLLNVTGVVVEVDL